MNVLKTLLAFFGLAAGVAVAQVPTVETDAEGRAARVQAILETAQVKLQFAREQIGPPTDETTRVTLYAAIEAIRADTEEKLAGVLTGEEELTLALIRANFPPTPPRFEALRFRKV